MPTREPSPGPALDRLPPLRLLLTANSVRVPNALPVVLAATFQEGEYG